MHWGIRKKREESHRQSGYKVYGDGRIEISKGVEMQRLVATNSKIGMSKSLTGHAYMSFLPTDNAEYINTMAPKSKIKDLKRDTILTLETKNHLKSPSVKEAEQINIEVMKKYAKELEAFQKSTKKNKNVFTDVSKESLSYLNTFDGAITEFVGTHKGTPEMHKEFQMWSKNQSNEKYDPLIHPEKYPSIMYAAANRRIGETADSSAQLFTSKLLAAVEHKGYNMLRDENDVGVGRWAAPVIVIKPESNVAVTLSKKISGRTLRQSQKYIERVKRDWKKLGLDEYMLSTNIKTGLAVK
jgi:hypothetical protein